MTALKQLLFPVAALLGLLADGVRAQSNPVPPAPPQTPTALAFYVGGHQDDWQLFRGNAAWRDLRNPATRVVFIYATAGDAGQTDGWWEARERGAVASARRVAGPVPLTVEVASFRGHPIVRYTTGNSVSYFLRLPDGQYQSGKGYPAYNNESLSQLRDSGKPVSAVDRSTSYQSWEDFRQTLQGIADFERSRLPNVTLPRISGPDYAGTDNARQDCDAGSSCNRCDHPDHLAVGQALRRFVAGTYDRVWWVGYASETRPENLRGPDFSGKGAVFFAYANAVLSETTLNGKPQQPNLGDWRAWGARDYFRMVGRDQPDSDAPVCGP